MQCDLNQKNCKPCEGGVKPMTEDEARAMLQHVSAWELGESGDFIHRRFEFKGFNKVMGFLNALAWIANQENHHPDVSYGYNYVEVTFSTHAIDGLSENDFICASKVGRLLG